MGDTTLRESERTYNQTKTLDCFLKIEFPHFEGKQKKKKLRNNNNNRNNIKQKKVKKKKKKRAHSNFLKENNY